MGTLRELVKSVVPAGVRSKFRQARTSAAHQAMRRRHAGNAVQCCICEAQFSSFGPYGLTSRPNAFCFDCGSLERHRLLWMYLQRHTDLLTGGSGRLLHIAPELVFYERFSALKGIEYMPGDLHSDASKYQRYKNTTPISKVDVTEIPYPDDHFDAILCSHVLEHVPDDGKAMRELRRVLRPGIGWAVIQVPVEYDREATYEDFSITDPRDREIAFGQHDHVRRYGRDYPDRLKQAGFHVTEDRFVEQFSKEEIFEYGLTPNEIIYRCSK